MNKLYLLFLSFLFTMMMISCSKKHHPSKNAEPAKTDTLAIKKPVVKPRVKAPFAKTIIVNDNVAKKSIDGRLYYDLEGHRYWKNYRDGKYYIFNQSMYSNDDFKPR